MDPVAWSEYQERTAELFRSIGLEATVETPVEGARATHAVDVLVRFTRFGVQHTWVAECKHWKSPVGKAEVLVLQQVVADTGADRGFLLSESGFQSGAIAAARWTNITLTNLEDLRSAAAEEARSNTVAAIQRRYAAVTRQMHDLSPYTGFHRRVFGDGLDPATVLEVHASGFEVGLEVQRVTAGVEAEAQGLDPQVAALEAHLLQFEAEVSQLQRVVDGVRQDAAEAVGDVTAATARFFDLTRTLASSDDPSEVDRLAPSVVTSMRAISDAAERIRTGGSQDASQKAGQLMRRLIEYSYLLPTGPDTSPDDVDADERAVAGLLAELG